MIIYPPNIENLRTSNIFYSNKESIRKMALMLMVNLSEGAVDMVCDMPEEYTTKEKIEECFNNVHEQALDLLDDYIFNLKQTLEAELKAMKYTSRVRRLDYSKTGELEDITVEIEVEKSIT